MDILDGAGLQECHRRSHIALQNEFHSFPFDHQSILIKDQFIGTEKIV